MPKLSHLDDFIVDSSPAVDPPDTRFVPNKFPRLPPTSNRIAIIGEAPGADEIKAGEPFVGASGHLLNQLLSKANIIRENCFVGNVCQFRPRGNEFSMFDWNGELVQASIVKLEADLSAFAPNLVICLGGASLHLMKEGNVAPKCRKHKGGHINVYPNSITDWRGSLFKSYKGLKCLATLHPAACLRQYEWLPLLTFDIRKASAECKTPTITLPQRTFDVNLPFDTLCAKLERILKDKPTISTDIEGYWDNLKCLGIATSPSYAFIVPFTNVNGSSYYETPEQECRIWYLVAKIMADPDIFKIWQNGLYDRFVFQYGYKIMVRGSSDDTMLKHWELYCELEKSLAFQTSIYTKEPFYKSDSKTNDRDTFFRYCCRDAAVTFEINSILDDYLDDKQKKHYCFNHDLLDPILFMECRGIRYNKKKAKQFLTIVNALIYELQHKLNLIAAANGVDIGPPPDASKERLRAAIAVEICYKNDPTRPKSGFVNEWHTLNSYLSNDRTAPLTDAERGHISIVCGWSMNIKSPLFKTFLYETLNLPKQYHEVTKELSVNEEALLNLQKKEPHPAVDLALQITSLRTRAQMLSIGADNDGRVRAGYNIVGTETGRITCYTSPTGSGYNLQTIPSEDPLKAIDHPLRNGMRSLFEADDGHYLFQCDLSGADGWTVGANLAALGKPTMLDDLRFGLKPAAVVCYMLRYGNSALDNKNRAEIKELLKEVKKEAWDYFACKQGIWGICYLMGPDKLALVIAKRSEGKLWMSRTEVGNFRDAVYKRYDVQIWHNWMSRHLKAQPYPPKFTAASGHTRRFFGRKDEILGEALSFEPQANTTYATNQAMHNLWTDNDNRIISDVSPVSRNEMGKSRLRIEPLHQIHDAILGQFRISDTAWAVDRIKRYFNNELTIARQKITIPFEGTYGTNWAFDKESLKGKI